MKATNHLISYATDSEADLIRRKANQHGFRSVSRFGIAAMLHWRPNRSPAGQPRATGKRAIGFPGRAAMPMRL